MKTNQNHQNTEQTLLEEELRQINGGATGYVSDASSTLTTPLIKSDRPPYQTTPVFIIAK